MCAAIIQDRLQIFDEKNENSFCMVAPLRTYLVFPQQRWRFGHGLLQIPFLRKKNTKVEKKLIPLPGHLPPKDWTTSSAELIKILFRF
jgi:hypothetical protein